MKTKIIYGLLASGCVLSCESWLMKKGEIMHLKSVWYRRRVHQVLLKVLLMLCVATIAQGNEWIPVTGTEALQNFMSGRKAERTLPSGSLSRGEYYADGTGTLFAWGAAIKRTWTVQGDDQICVKAERVSNCYQIERNSDNANLYRAHDVATGKVVGFQVTDGKSIATADPGGVDNKGGAATASAAELAAELSNPNTAVATLTLKNQFRWFEGDLPEADDQSSYTLLFQPGLPFVLDSGDKIIWRPAIPLIFDQPVSDPAAGGFGGETGLGDIVFDLAYAPKNESGLLFAYGLITSLPTATDDALGSDRFTLGPELMIGKVNPTYIYGMFPNHQWDVGGSGDADINLSTIQLFYTHLLGGGYNVGSGPSITYDWTTEQWTVPLQINAGKTVVFNGRPWKLSVELNYYVEKSDTFGPEWMLSFNIAPVVKNGLAGWFGL
jgi:hypothetical protein